MAPNAWLPFVTSSPAASLSLPLSAATGLKLLDEALFSCSLWLLGCLPSLPLLLLLDAAEPASAAAGAATATAPPSAAPPSSRVLH